MYTRCGKFERFYFFGACVANFVFEPLHPALVARVLGRRFTAGKQAGWAESCGEGGNFIRSIFTERREGCIVLKKAQFRPNSV